MYDDGDAAKAQEVNAEIGNCGERAATPNLSCAGSSCNNVITFKTGSLMRYDLATVKGVVGIGSRVS